MHGLLCFPASMHLPFTISIYQSSCHLGHLSCDVDQWIMSASLLEWPRMSSVQHLYNSTDGLADPFLGSCTYILRIDNLPVVKQGTAEPQGQYSAEALQRRSRGAEVRRGGGIWIFVVNFNMRRMVLQMPF